MKIADNHHDYANRVNIIQKLTPQLFDRSFLNGVLEIEYQTPLSTYLYKNIRPIFQSLIPNDFDFEGLFNVFEYLLSLNYMYLVEPTTGRDWAPFGECTWKSGRHYQNVTYLDEFFSEAEKLKDNWSILKAGMFGGNYENFSETKKKLEEFLKNIHHH